MISTKIVSILTWMICLLICLIAVSLTEGGPIRRQAAQSEKTVPIGGNVILLCPLVSDDSWQWVYWKKDNHTIYSLYVPSNTPWTNDTRYEGSNNATRLTIKDLKKTDSGIYHCKVATLVSIKERGHVLLSVTDQEVGLSTTSPGVPLTASTMILPQPAEDNPIFSVSVIVTLIISIIISVTISVIIMCLGFKHRQRLKNLQAGFVGAVRRLAGKKGTSTPVAPDSAYCEMRDKEGTCTDLLSSDTRRRDDVDMDDKPKENSCASEALKICKTDDVTI